MNTRIDAGAARVSENRDSAMVPQGGNFQQAETARPEPPVLHTSNTRATGSSN